MGWAIGFDRRWDRFIGYAVPATCDHPGCQKRIDRGLSYVCGGQPYGGDSGCGLHFCPEHGGDSLCERCEAEQDPFEPKPDIDEWVNHQLTDESWEKWRLENPEKVAEMKARMGDRPLPLAEDPEVPEPTDDELIDYLALATGNIYDVGGWTKEQRDQAQKWATASFYEASDYEGIEIPRKPDFMP